MMMTASHRKTGEYIWHIPPQVVYMLTQEWYICRHSKNYLLEDVQGDTCMKVTEHNQQFSMSLCLLHEQFKTSH